MRMTALQVTNIEISAGRDFPHYLTVDKKGDRALIRVEA
jgi:hypothetical protein